MLLCRLEEIADPEGRGFRLPGRDDFMVIRKGEAVFAYVNSCPHVGVPLDMLPDRFLMPDGSRIICSMHGALFDVHDGVCVRGPCKGDRLEPVAVRVRDGWVELVDG